MRALKFGQKAARSGKARSIVVFLHGYGADGADLLGLAEPLALHMPDTLFLAPDAPEQCSGYPVGRQWFPIPRLDGSSEADATVRLDAAAEDLHAFLDARLDDAELTAANLALIGFSQGTMMALHAGLRRKSPCAAIVGYSGTLVGEEHLSEVTTKPPVLLIHGDQDEVIPVQALFHAGQALSAAGVPVEWHVSHGIGHGIDGEGLMHGLGFMPKAFGVKAGG